MGNDLLFRIAYLLLWIVFIAARFIPSRKAPTVKRSRKKRFQAIRQEGMRVFLSIFIAFYGNFIVAFNPHSFVLAHVA